MSNNKFYHNNNEGKSRPDGEAKPQQSGANSQTLKRPIEDLGLSEATFNALKAGRVSVIGDLTRRTFQQMYRIQNIGKKNCIEISKALAKLGVNFAQEGEAQIQRGQSERKGNDRQQSRQDNRQEAKQERRESNNNNRQESRQERRNSQGKQDRQNAQARQDRREQDRRDNRQERRDNNNNGNNNNNKNKKQKSQADALNEYLSKQYAGMSIAEILMGRRRRPVVEKIERPPLTEKSLIKFCRKGKWGYKDWKGNVIVPPSYEEAFGFYEERACVEMEGKLGYIDRENNLVIDFKYDCATSFSEGLASVTVGDKSGYIDIEGNQVVDFIYDIATPFSDGKAIVRANDRWGVLNRETLSVFWR